MKNINDRLRPVLSGNTGKWSTVFATEERKRTSMSFEVWRCGLNYLPLLHRRPLNGRSGQREGSRTAEQVRAGQACGGAYESLDKLGNDHRFLLDCARYGVQSCISRQVLASSFPARWNAALATSSHTFQLDNHMPPCRLSVLRALTTLTRSRCLIPVLAPPCWSMARLAPSWTLGPVSHRSVPPSPTLFYARIDIHYCGMSASETVLQPEAVLLSCFAIFP
ncbi:uncharacterized protein CLUP02_08140 [Colletotrichum lupini]|uniref:Uncharacterized protein n=1 Tax=Colletotrichum lupini TaxID=145971 RepID=A0A9Q8SSK3_9PEZI|nr:uncharacterized protein CLUP02_08140 [Colletotrichum lupini]UQC82650.1 hypothetical protein CLUP02_08140 [Colletotrichum lupini]